MTPSQDSADFIRSHFRSVWSLELLLHLRREPDRLWTRDDLVDRLRASHAVIATSIDALLAGGLIIVEADGAARYQAVHADLDRKVAEVEALYAKKPDAVRRLIVQSISGGVSAFADAFRLRRD